MEVKKNPKQDLQRRYNLHLSVGFLVALALVVTAFEWKTAYEKPITLEEITGPFEPVDIAPQTVIPEPPKPKVIMPQIIEVPEEEIVEEFVAEFDPGIPAEVPELVFENELPEEVAPEYVDIAEVMPEPSQGMTAFMAYLAKNIKYPKSGQRMGLQGKVFVQFIVDEQGNLTDIKVIKGINADFDNEAVRVLSQSPNKWKPGKQRGRPVKVRMVIPIIYKLN